MPLSIVDAHVYTRDGREIVREVSLEIREGHIYVLMGPNGAGKSSLAQAVMGHRNYVYRGKLLLDGEDISRLNTAERVHRGLTLAVQIPVEIDGVRVSEILVRVARKFQGAKTMKDAMQIIREAFDVVGLPESLLSREYMAGMSGGERKKLELARIIIQKPKIAILDEPDSGVDVESIPRIAAAIERLAESGTGVLLITHQPRLLTRLIPDKVYVMVGGRIVAEGGIELVRRIEEEGYAPFRR